MNPLDPPAADLGAIRARHFDQYGMCGSGLCGQFWPCDAARLYDAQAARLAAAEQERDDWRERAEQYKVHSMDLAALEAAARQVLDEHGTRTLTSGLRRLEVVLRALAAPPGEAP